MVQLPLGIRAVRESFAGDVVIRFLREGDNAGEWLPMMEQLHIRSTGRAILGQRTFTVEISTPSFCGDIDETEIHIRLLQWMQQAARVEIDTRKYE